MKSPLLDRSDQLLDYIETNLIHGQRRIPPQVQRQIVGLAAQVDVPISPVRNYKAAHDSLFEIQDRLLTRLPTAGRAPAASYRARLLADARAQPTGDVEVRDRVRRMVGVRAAHARPALRAVGLRRHMGAPAADT